MIETLTLARLSGPAPQRMLDGGEHVPLRRRKPLRKLAARARTLVARVAHALGAKSPSS